MQCVVTGGSLNMAAFSCSISTFFWFCVLGYVVSEIPDYIKVCKRTDPNVSKCINASVEALRPKLLSGIPELDVPGVDPLYLKEIHLSRGPQGARLDATVNNLKVNGAGGFFVKALKANLKDNVFDFDVLLPKLKFDGNYKVAMKILLLNIHGTGALHGNFTNYACTVRLSGHKIIKKGKEYLELDKMKLKLHVGDAHIELLNLFNGDPVLGPMANRLINENQRVFLDEIIPTLEQSLAELFTDIGNKITLNFTYKELFPES